MEEEDVESLVFLASSDSRSSDEENENQQQRGRRSTRVFDRQSIHKRLSTVRPTHSTPSSGRKRLESQSVCASTKTKLPTTDIRIAMLNERKQKKMVALFYWRRKSLETYFSAWRWVALSLLRSVKREMRHQKQQLYTYPPLTPSSADPRHRLIVLKRSLRRIKKKVEKDHKGHAYMVWQTYTAAQKKLRIIEQKAVAKRTTRLLRLCLLNWENAATDQWTHRFLVDYNNARVTRRLKHTVFKGWKSLLPLRQARKKWRAKATRRYADKLRALLHMWRDLRLIG
ncbi:hypothetical protein Poli38472_000228 [Pythium oligandrum]|uniref:Sfi1 spindle body domain-containing protein n=1 Tax=Pythium oligandrum TaxID=41045 RepID=A0A8K1CBC5_PYTOL|nr:hypothetical protein Poli38472_000228 [Pythium oligandrum]|eukprot:TMW60186.1 hypothetical protein Poli38472_000228 [Pythium oligandrum]